MTTKLDELYERKKNITLKRMSLYKEREAIDAKILETDRAMGRVINEILHARLKSR